MAVDWWAYIWLKEGYATFYSHYAINHTNPEMKPWEMFIPSILAVAMNFDATNGIYTCDKKFNSIFLFEI